MIASPQFSQIEAEAKRSNNERRISNCVRASIMSSNLTLSSSCFVSGRKPLETGRLPWRGGRMAFVFFSSVSHMFRQQAAGIGRRVGVAESVSDMSTAGGGDGRSTGNGLAYLSHPCQVIGKTKTSRCINGTLLDLSGLCVNSNGQKSQVLAPAPFAAVITCEIATYLTCSSGAKVPTLGGRSMSSARSRGCRPHGPARVFGSEVGSAKNLYLIAAGNQQQLQSCQRRKPVFIFPHHSQRHARALGQHTLYLFIVLPKQNQRI